jgi:hypothetical protein
VCAARSRYQIFVIVDVSDASLLGELERHPALACLRARRHRQLHRSSGTRAHSSSSVGGCRGLTVVHASPAHVQSTDGYREWIQKSALQRSAGAHSTLTRGDGGAISGGSVAAAYNRDQQSGEEPQHLPYRSATRLRLRLAALDPDSYSLPHSCSHFFFPPAAHTGRDDPGADDEADKHIAVGTVGTVAATAAQGEDDADLQWDEIFQCCLPAATGASTDESSDENDRQRRRLTQLLCSGVGGIEGVGHVRSQEMERESKAWSLRRPRLRDADTSHTARERHGVGETETASVQARLQQQREQQQETAQQPRENVAMAALKARLMGDMETYRTLMSTATKPSREGEAEGDGGRGLGGGSGAEQEKSTSRVHERALYELLRHHYQGSAVDESSLPTDTQRQEGAGSGARAIHAAQAETEAGAETETVAPFEVIILGTGCKSPSKLRNCASIFFRLPDTPRTSPRDFGDSTRGPPARAAAKGFSMLIDAGEGSLAALQREFGGVAAPPGSGSGSGGDTGSNGVHGVDAILRSLSMVWVSHMHADHHAGLPAILDARHAAATREAQRQRDTATEGDSGRERAAPPPPLLVVGPTALGPLLDAQCAAQQQEGGRPGWLFSNVSACTLCLCLSVSLSLSSVSLSLSHSLSLSASAGERLQPSGQLGTSAPARAAHDYEGLGRTTAPELCPSAHSVPHFL